MRACIWMAIPLGVFAYSLWGQEPTNRNPYVPPPLVKKSVLVGSSDGIKEVQSPNATINPSGTSARSNPYLPTPLRKTTLDAVEAPTPAKREQPSGGIPRPLGGTAGEPDAPFARPLARIAQPLAAPVQGSGPDSQKREAIQELLSEVADLHPGEYGAQEKLLEVLQLERLIGVRNQALEIFRYAPSALASAGTPDEAANKAIALRTSIWTDTEIPVSWDVDAATFNRYARERALVKQAVELTWEQASAVRFTGWDLSTNGSRGIRIGINDEGPHCKRLGRYLDGMPEGMVLNFTFENWCPVCVVNHPNSIQYIAVHEFGHALGLAHEQNSEQAPQWCQELRQGTPGDWALTVYDPQSIMNYCNPKWNNDGRLSTLDIRAIRIMYGNPRAPSSPPSDAPFARPLQGAAQGPLAPDAKQRPLQDGPKSDAAGVPQHVDRGVQSSQRNGAIDAGSGPVVDVQRGNAPEAPRQASGPADAARMGQSRRVCLVMASTSRLQGDRMADLNRIEEVFRIGCIATGLDYSQAVKKVGIRSKQELLDTLTAGPSNLANSTLVCYLKIHGGTDKTNGEHVMETDGAREAIARSELRQFLVRQGARLTVLLTDSCSSADVPSEAVSVGADGFPRELFLSLFARPSNLVDINSSTYAEADGTILNQNAWMDDEGNAIFTGVFAECFAIRGPPQAQMLDAVRRDGQITWSTFHPYLRQRTDEVYQVVRDSFIRRYFELGQPVRTRPLFDSLNGQPHQYPRALSLGN